MTYIGRPVPRVEDEDLVTGRGRYVGDIAVDGCLHAAFVRSQDAHGRLLGVDVSEARAMPGVLAAYAASDLPDLPRTPASIRGEGPPGMERPALAVDRVRFVGDPVAVVLAESPAVAEDAAETVIADVEPLPAVLDPTEAAAADAVRLFDGTDNIAELIEHGSDVEEDLARAPVVVEERIRNQRLAAVSIEPRATLVVPEGDGGLTVWCSHQTPHRLRAALAGAFGIPPDRVRVIVPEVGGAFGAKSQTYPEYVVLVHLARSLGRPIRWIERRSEAFVGSLHGRGQNQRLRLGADADGRILALDAEIDGDLGAYPHTGGLVPTLTAWMMSGPYRIPRLHVRVRTVVTNATPTGSYRGAGRPEAAYGLERTMDALARRLRMDPAELRRRNFIRPEEFPYRSPTGALYDSGEYERALDAALDLVRYGEVRDEQRRRRAAGTGPLLGMGIGFFLERSGGQAGMEEFGSVEVLADGTIVARSGSSAHGQGHRTVFGQVVASVFQVNLERVRVLQGDTAEVPEGIGTFASRSMQVGGTSLHVAGRRVLEEASKRAADLLGVDPGELGYARGLFAVEGSPERSVELGEVARRSGPLSASESIGLPQAFPFGAYVAVVEIDPETGEVSVLRLVAVDDCGVVVNPMVVEGQTVGSIAQGLAQSLYEGIAYDEIGQPLTANLTVYGVPTANEIPELVLGETVTPNPNAPLGTKGAGEAGCIGTPPAIVNAIEDALWGFDTRGLDMPVTPEKVWRCLQRPLEREAMPSVRGEGG